MEPCNTGSSAEISPIQGQGTLMSHVGQNKQTTAVTASRTGGSSPHFQPPLWQCPDTQVLKTVKVGMKCKLHPDLPRRTRLLAEMPIW